MHFSLIFVRFLLYFGYQECTVDKLLPDSLGPSKLSELSYIPFNPLDEGVPLFDCQKIDAYDHRGNFKRNFRFCIRC